MKWVLFLFFFHTGGTSVQKIEMIETKEDCTALLSSVSTETSLMSPSTVKVRGFCVPMAKRSIW